MSTVLTSQPLVVREDGDANFFGLLDAPSHWLAVIQMNGELMPARQREYVNLFAAAPLMLNVLIAAVESAGYSLSGPTDSRAAEHGEPAWVCNARGVIAKATSGTT